LIEVEQIKKTSRLKESIEEYQDKIVSQILALNPKKHKRRGSTYEFLARTTSKNYVVRLLYYSVAVSCTTAGAYSMRCKGQERDGGEHVIVLEMKLTVLFIFYSLAQT
jgi:hypothetical protein